MGTPLYIGIADHLRRLVAASEIGEILPSDAELCSEFGVSRMTARHAVQLLVNEGLVRRVRGKGTFVRAKRAPRRLGSPLSFTTSMGRRGLSVGSEILELTEAAISPEEAEALGLEPGASTTVLTRLRRADDIPMAVERAVLHPDVAHIATGLDGSLHAAFEAVGRRPSHALARVTARLASREERDLLQLTSRGVVVCERRLITDQHGEPLEHTETVYAAARYEFEALLDRGLDTEEGS